MPAEGASRLRGGEGPNNEATSVGATSEAGGGSTQPPVAEFSRPRRLGPLRTLSQVAVRVRCWLKVLGEYPRMLAVHEMHRRDGWFDYGTPPGSFAQLDEHSAVRKLLALRGPGGSFRSTLQFEADHPILPTYLPIEEGAAAALGAVSLAAAELFELRTGRAQRVAVSQSGAGLTTAQYLFIYAQPSGRWRGLHGFESTMAAEGVVKPHRKAYRCKDGRWIFLHGGFPRLKQGITNFLQCECTVPAIAAACAEWEAGPLEAAMQARGLAATMCRSPREWRESEQGQAVLRMPPVTVTPGAAAVPTRAARALPGQASRPLSDVLVLDFSHVTASPSAVGKTLWCVFTLAVASR